MILAIRYIQVITTVTLVISVINLFWAHYERNKMVEALASHQSHSIAAFANVAQLIANGISKRVDAQAEKNDTIIEQNAKPTPTPQVVTKTKTKTRTRIIRPTPKPFKFFGP